jgi:hypothetical protein
VLLATLQAARPADPFFSNDIAGVLKLLTTVVVGAGIIGGILIRLVFISTNKRQDDMQRDMDGLGRRLNEEATARAECTTALRELGDRVTRNEGTVGAVVAGQAELKATVEAMRSQSAEQQRDIMTAIMQTGQQFNTAFTELKVEVAKQGVRNELGAVLAEGFGTIAQIMRESRQQGR